MGDCAELRHFSGRLESLVDAAGFEVPADVHEDTVEALNELTARLDACDE